MGRRQKWGSACHVGHACPAPAHVAFSWELSVLDGERTRRETWSSSWGWRDPPWSPPGACTLPTPGRAPGGCPLGDGQWRLRHPPSWWEPPARREHDSAGAVPPGLWVPLGQGLRVLQCPGLVPPSAQLTRQGLFVPQKHRRSPCRQTLLPCQTRLSVFCRNLHGGGRKKQTLEPGLLPCWLDTLDLCDSEPVCFRVGRGSLCATTRGPRAGAWVARTPLLGTAPSLKVKRSLTGVGLRGVPWARGRDRPSRGAGDTETPLVCVGPVASETACPAPLQQDCPP